MIPQPAVHAATRMSGISKSFRGIRALENVDFEVEAGEIHALLGENGAGKSTLLKILCGLETPDAGAIEVDGRRVSEHTPEASRSAGVAMIFQEMSLIPTLTVAQNIFLNREPLNRLGLIDDRQAMERARGLIDSFGVNIDPAATVANLGAGQRQLTEIVKAISQRARVLILDEPTSALSESEVDRLLTMLLRLKADGVAIIYVSHRMDEIMRIADRVSILREGRRIITAPLCELSREAMIGYIVGQQNGGFSEVLRESEQRFRQLAENIHEVFWMLDPGAQRVLYVSPAFERIWGRTRESVMRNPRSFLETVHEADRARIDAAYESAMANRAPLEEEYSIVHPDRSIRWIRDRAFPIRDEKGRVYRVARITEDVTERKRFEEERQHSFAQLRALAARLQNVREEERKTVAREIHDELGQALTAIKIDFSYWIHDLPPAEHSARAGSILKLVDQAIQTVRRISTQLRPGILDDLGLVAAVEWAAEEFEGRSGIRCYLQVPQEEIEIDQERATAVFRIFQETLTNVARHAGATELRVSLAQENGILSLEVRDNGKGVTEEQIFAARSLGILGMRERALLLGGDFEIRGAPGEGTTVHARIPEIQRRSVE
jgi:PAS domain S-box-containing protein